MDDLFSPTCFNTKHFAKKYISSSTKYIYENVNQEPNYFYPLSQFLTHLETHECIPNFGTIGFHAIHT